MSIFLVTYASFPSLTKLFYILVDLAQATTAYYFFVGSWDDVLEQYDKLVDWRDDFLTWAWDNIKRFTAPFYDWTTSYIAYLQAWRDWAKENIDNLFAYVNDHVAGVVAGWNTFKDKIKWLLSTVWATVSWFFTDVTKAVKAILGSVWTWLVWFWTYLRDRVNWLLNTVWSTVLWFFTDVTKAVKAILGSAWTWLVWFWTYLRDRVVWLLSTVWGTVQWFFTDLYKSIPAILGLPWQFVRDLYALGPGAILNFVRDALPFWYMVWSQYRKRLFDFLSDPAGFTLLWIRDKFLDWFEKLVADNW